MNRLTHHQYQHNYQKLLFIIKKNTIFKKIKVRINLRILIIRKIFVLQIIRKIFLYNYWLLLLFE